MKTLKELLEDCPNLIKENLNPLYVEKGHIIITQGSEPKNVFFLISGSVNVYRLALNGINYLEYAYTNYEMFGEIEAINGREILSNVRAEDDCELLCIEVENFFKWMKIDEDFNQYVMFQLSEKIYEACINSQVNIVYPIKYKVMYYLYSRGIQGKVYIKKDELVTAIAGRIRSTNRIINELVEDRIIEADIGIIKILNIEKLKQEMKKFEI